MEVKLQSASLLLYNSYKGIDTRKLSVDDLCSVGAVIKLQNYNLYVITLVVVTLISYEQMYT